MQILYIFLTKTKYLNGLTTLTKHHIVCTKQGNSGTHVGFQIIKKPTRTLGKKILCYTTSIHGLSARWCPMSPHFLTRWVSRLLGWLWYPGLLPVLVSIAFPFAFHVSGFLHSLFFFFLGNRPMLQCIILSNTMFLCWRRLFFRVNKHAFVEH